QGALVGRRLALGGVLEEPVDPEFRALDAVLVLLVTLKPAPVVLGDVGHAVEMLAHARVQVGHFAIPAEANFDEKIFRETEGVKASMDFNYRAGYSSSGPVRVRLESVQLPNLFDARRWVCSEPPASARVHRWSDRHPAAEIGRAAHQGAVELKLSRPIGRLLRVPERADGHFTRPTWSSWKAT